MTDLLKGVRVVELAIGIAGSYCGKMLADLGADVVKVEPPGGDPLRGRGPFATARPDGEASGFFLYLNQGKRGITLDLESPQGREQFLDIVATADVLLEAREAGQTPQSGFTVAQLQARNSRLVVVSLSPFGATGPRASWRGNDMIAFQSSGFAFGFPSISVPTLDLPPLNAPGHGADFFLGEFAAVSAMHGLLVAQAKGVGMHLDLSAQEALASEHYHYFNLPSVTEDKMSERIVTQARGNATVTSLPCTDGWVALSPRQEHQWANWLEVMGSPAWGKDPRFARHEDRQSHWESLYPLLADWTRLRSRAEIVDAAEQLRVPCFPFGTAPDLLASAQFAARAFFNESDGEDKAGAAVLPARPYQVDGAPGSKTARAPRLGEHNEEVRAKVAARLSASPAQQAREPEALQEEDLLHPLRGVRIADFSWVLAGPICTKYLAALGAEVIKFESRSRPDLSKRDARFEQLNPGKRSLSLNMKQPQALKLARELVLQSDVVIENFSANVMDKFGLGYEALHRLKPKLIMASSSVFGRTGPERDRVGYGTLIQCLTGWAGLSAYPGMDPDAAGCPWTDPLVGIMETFLVLAAVWHQRRTGQGAYIDLSMVETTVAALAEPILLYSLRKELSVPRGNHDPMRAPQGAYRTAGKDNWLALSIATDEEWIRLCRLMEREDLAADPALRDVAARKRQHDLLDAAIGAWTKDRDAGELAQRLQDAGIAAAPTMNPGLAPADAHLRARQFYGEVPRLGTGARWAARVPWLVNGVRIAQLGAPPEIGADNRYVVQTVLGKSEAAFDRWVQDGTLY